MKYLLNPGVLLSFLVILLFTACKDTEGCTDPLANNTGDYDLNCCCTYDAENFYGSYLGDIDFLIFSDLDAEDVIFDITESSSPDSVLIKITTDTQEFTPGASIDGDSIIIYGIQADFELGPLGTSDVIMQGGGILDQDSDSLKVNMTITAPDLDNLSDQFTFEGKKI